MAIAKFGRRLAIAILNFCVLASAAGAQRGRVARKCYATERAPTYCEESLNKFYKKKFESLCILVPWGLVLPPRHFRARTSVPMKYRNYCITLWVEHQPPEGEWQWVLEAYVEEDILRFAAYGLETCPTTQRQHLQCYVCFPHPVTWERCCYLFPKCHVEPMRGSLVANEAYCSKEGQFVKIGDEPNEQGMRSDLMRVREMVEEGERPMKIARTTQEESVLNCIAKHHRFWDEMYSEVAWEKRCREGYVKPKVRVFIGQSEALKSRRVWEYITYERAATDLFKCWDKHGEYYNGYHGQPFVFFEDVQKGFKLPDLSTFKELLDGYPVRVNCKFREPVVFNPREIFITSNHEWTTWYDFTPEDVVAIKRRLTTLVRVFKELPCQVEVDQDSWWTQHARQEEEIQQDEPLQAQEDVDGND